MAVNLIEEEEKSVLILMNAKQFSLIALLILTEARYEGKKSSELSFVCDSGTLRCVKRQPYAIHCGWRCIDFASDVFVYTFDCFKN